MEKAICEKSKKEVYANEKPNTSTKTKDMVLCALFVALISAGAFLKIPIPTLPITMQYLFTMLAGLLLGGKRGSFAVCVYILLGLMGLPVFTRGGGIGYIFQPSFGYLIGFAAGAYVTGSIAGAVDRPGFARLLAANFAGLGMVYLFGLPYYYCISNFYLNNPIGLGTLLLYCFLLTIPGDIFWCFVGAFLGKRLIPVIRNHEI